MKHQLICTRELKNLDGIDFKKIKPRRNEEHEERKQCKSLRRAGFSLSLRALGALRGEILFLDL
jgi:hypothetical protein